MSRIATSPDLSTTGEQRQILCTFFLLSMLGLPRYLCPE
jgi:hypothetical protein